MPTNLALYQSLVMPWYILLEHANEMLGVLVSHVFYAKIIYAEAELDMLPAVLS